MSTEHEETHHRPDLTRIAAHQKPYWHRAHRDWRLWVAVAAIGIALFIYITSVDLSLIPFVPRTR